MSAEAHTAAAVESTPLRLYLGRYARPLKGALGIALFIAAWQASVPLVGLEPYFYPSPADVWRAFIELVVTGSDGKEVHWSIELNSPNNLKRQGWARSSLKAGDQVSVTLNPLRNGKTGGLFNSVVLPDGKVLSEAAFAGGRPVNTPGSN